MKALLEYRDVWLIGGGGKTTLMYRLAAAWAERGESALCTTTTRIWPPTPDQCPDFRTGALTAVRADLRARPASRVTVASRVEGGKCQGFSADEALALTEEARHVVVEADGSAGRPLKAHAPHEPVVAAGASCVVAVVGGWSVGAPLDAEHVHRPERFSALTGRKLGEPVTAADVARAILDDQGWERAVPQSAVFRVVVTGEDRGIGDALAEHPKAWRLAGMLVLPP
ncbi:MAG: selenium cofactor biosynthesis protein YqeC [Myxococcales bacterium]